MYQGLGWEMLDWLVNFDSIINGSDNKIVLVVCFVKVITFLIFVVRVLWVYKIGVIGGFGSYVVFILEKELGIVMLVNKNYFNLVRVDVVWQIFNVLQ